MRELAQFSANVVAQFDNNYDNMLQFNGLMMDAANKIYDKYTKEESSNMLRKQFDKVLGINFKEARPMQRRQAWREHGKEIATLIEDVVLDRMNSGWNASNAAFMKFVREVNLADGDKNEFFAEDNSLLTVSVFAGNHHDVVRQAVRPGKAFSIETSWYVIKVYTDFELFQLGRIDWAALVDKMYESIEQHRYAALYTAFMSLDTSIPADMKLSTPAAAPVVDNIIDKIEAVKAATGKDVMLVGTRQAVHTLQKTVPYDLFSDGMKDEHNKKGLVGFWNGYECLALDRVNKAGTRESIFTADDHKKIMIVPVSFDDASKPIVRVNEGDVAYYESGMDGMKKDMTVDAEIAYKEGVGVIVSELFGEILFTA